MDAGVSLSGPRLAPVDGGAARQLVVLLHGLGADGNDLIGLGSTLAPFLPGAAFAAPNAPERCDMAPSGHQWFSLAADAETGRSAGVRRAAPGLDRFIDEELSWTGLDDSRLALLGFSQGTMMALHVGLRRARPCAGIVGYSGALVDPASLKDEARAKPPVLLVHGADDDLIPAEALFAAVGGLGAAGLAVRWHLSAGTGHAIDEAGLRLAAEFLVRAFTATSG